MTIEGIPPRRSSVAFQGREDVSRRRTRALVLIAQLSFINSASILKPAARAPPTKTEAVHVAGKHIYIAFHMHVARAGSQVGLVLFLAGAGSVT